MNRKQSERRIPAWTLWLGVAVWVTVPFLIFAVVAFQNKSADFVPTSPVWAPVTASAEKTVEDVDIAMKWSSGAQLLAPSWQGVVQSVGVSVNQAVTNGTVIATVDGVRRLAWQTPGAFYRPLSYGDRGRDVLWLKSLLHARGASMTSTDTFDRATLHSVIALARDLGVPKQVRVQSFDPTWIVYLPTTISSLQSVDITTGAPAPSAGSIIGAGAPTLAEATVTTPASSTQDSGPNQITEAQARVQYSDRVLSQSVAIRPGDQLTYSNTPLKLNGTPPRVDPASLAVLAKALTPKTASVPAQLSRTVKKGELQVPSAAIASSPTPKLCVRRAGVTTEVKVKVITDTSGQTRVVGDLVAGSKVRVPGPSAAMPCKSNSNS